MAADMDQNPELDGSLAAEAEQAAQRWRTRARVRDQRSKALAEGRLLDADSPERLARRVNTLVENVRRATRLRRPPGNATLRRLVDREAPVTPTELNADILREVVLGARDFLSVEFLERGLQASRSVGRIVIRTGAGVVARGTGFLVAPGIAITNHHVLPDAATAQACGLEMDYELNSFGPPRTPSLFQLEPERLLLLDKALDFALVAVAARSPRGTAIASYPALPLIAATGKIAITDHDSLNIIQHPLGREKEVVVRDNRVLDIRTGNEAGAEAMDPFLHYQGDTEKGSSGSPVFNDEWEVVALHHSGVPKTDAKGNWLDKDGKIWREGEQPVTRIAWVANEGIRVSRLVAAFQAAAPGLSPAARALVTPLLEGARPAAPAEAAEPSALATVEPDAVPDAPLPPVPTVVPPLAASGGGVTLEVPLRITVSLGGAVATAGTPAPRAAARALPSEALEKLDASDFADRDGFDPDFLGVRVALPKFKTRPKFGGVLRVPRPARPGDATELRYHHYSVVMCAGRRTAYVSAVNIDYAARANASRDDGTSTWRLDPRLDPEQQLGREFYDNNDYDKGHLTRRDDAAWGRTMRLALAANNDTFFYTNAAPQHFNFNRSDRFTGLNLGLWGDLEDWIAEQGGDQRSRLCVFNGPVFGPHDKKLKDALVPLKFYKLVVWRDGTATPGAAAFVLDQADLVAALPEEAIDPGRFKVDQVRITKLTGMLDLDFSALKAFDRFGKPSVHESLDEDVAEAPVRKLSDIRL